MNTKNLKKSELIKYITELEKQLEIDEETIRILRAQGIFAGESNLPVTCRQLADSGTNDETEKLKKAVSLLKEVVAISCKDHCPHHAMPEACRNCAIKKKMLELADIR